MEDKYLGVTPQIGLAPCIYSNARHCAHIAVIYYCFALFIVISHCALLCFLGQFIQICVFQNVFVRL